MCLRTTLLFHFIIFWQLGVSQVNDDFSDGDFTSDPVWSGDDELWFIDEGQLRSKNSEANTFYLSTPSSVAQLAFWEFYVNLKFSTSGANYVDVYLISDALDLAAANNGYFIRIGDTKDEIVLYKVSSGDESPLIGKGNTEGVVNSGSNNPFRIRVSRDGLDLWTLEYDDGVTGEYTLAGSAIDSETIISNFFGIKVVQSSANGPIDNHYFDDIAIKQLTIDSTAVISNQQIEVFLNLIVGETDAENPANYALTGFAILDVRRDDVETSKVIITLDEATPLRTEDLNLTLSPALTKNEEASYGFSYTQLEVVSLLTLSETEIQLTFNDQLDPSSASNESAYVINNGIGLPVSAVLDPEDQNVVRLTLDNPLSESITFQLAISGVENEAQNSTLVTAKDFDFVIPLVVDTAYVLSENELVIRFNKDVVESLAESILNYTIDQGLGNPDASELQADGTSVLITFNEAINTGDYTVTVSHVTDTDGNTVDAGGRSAVFDYLELMVERLEQLNETTLLLKFNQGLTQGPAETLPNYLLSEIGNPIATTYNALDSTVTLEFEQLYNTTHFLSVINLSNEQENAFAGDQLNTLEIGIEVPTTHRGIIINELMSDPSPVVGLPEAEYVELYNRSSGSINLKGFRLNGETFPEYIFMAGNYLIITDDTDAVLFGDLENVLALTTFDGLTNSGEAVVFTDQFLNVVDSIFYEPSWYGDTEKANGGFALELIDPLQPCSGTGNWSASSAESGGTPGLQNAVYSDAPDTIPPSLVEVEVIGADTLKLFFSEAIDEAMLTTSSFELDGYAIKGLEKLTFSSWYLFLEAELASEKFNQLSVDHLSDCYGNILESQAKKFYFDNTAPIPERLVVLSENELALVFHEPLAVSEAEDETHYAIDGFNLDQALLQDSATNRVHLTFDAPFIEGDAYEVTILTLEDTLGNETSALTENFEFSNAIDTLYPIANNLLEIQFLEAPTPATALNSHHFFISGSEEHPEEVIADDVDPALFLLAFASNFPENKELLLYVEGLKNNANEKLMTPSFAFSLDTRAPALESLLVKSDSQLVLTFNEKLAIPESISSVLFQLEDSQSPRDVVALNNVQLQLIFEQAFQIEVEKKLTYTGVADPVGNSITTNRTISFVYDPKPPEVKDVLLLDDTTLAMRLSEKITFNSATDPTNYEINERNPIDISVSGPDSMEVRMVFSDIPVSEEAELVVQNLTDPFENTSGLQHIIFDSFTPGIVSLIPKSGSTLQVIFNKPMSSSAENPQHYLLSGYAIREVSKITPYSYLLTSDRLFQEGDSLILSTTGLESETGNILPEESVFETVFDIYFSDLKVLDPKTLLVKFETPLLSAYKAQFHLEGNAIILALPDGEDKSIVRLSLQNDLQENAPVQLFWSDLVDRYGRVIPDYSAKVVLDTQPPEVVAIQSDFFGVMDIIFSEEVDKNSAGSTNKYRLEDIGFPYTVTFSVDSVVHLDFLDQLEPSQFATLIISGLADLSGNFSDIDTINFTYEPPAVPQFGDIIINEIMADPAPVIGLPEVEYIELYNRSGDDYNLKSLTLSDATHKAMLPDYLLGAQRFVVLVDEGEDFSPLGVGTLKVNGFPTLGNTGDELTLLTVFGNTIDKVAYASSWYGNTEKDDGGYSLEIINPFGKCPGRVNWIGSEDESGGTPGEQNSVYHSGPDDHQPEVREVTVLSEESMQFTFSESMDSLSLVTAVVEGEGLTISSREVGGTYFDELIVHIDPGLVIGKSYEIGVGGAADCTGNEMVAVVFDVGVGKAPESGDLIFTEIMADPEPTVGLPNVEYLEIYNTSGSLISLNGVKLIDATDTTILPHALIDANAYFVLCPESGRPSFTNQEPTVGLSRWLSLNNSGEPLLLANAEIIAEVSYSRDWYEDSDKSDGGYSLEIINPFGECPGSVNWTGSKREIGGTPGEQNSVHSLETEGMPPAILSFEVVDESTAQIIFNEAMDSLSMVSALIEISKSLSASQLVSGSHHQILKVAFTTTLKKGDLYQLRISGARDCTGNEMEEASFTFGIGDHPSFNELLITEIMADPEPVIGLPDAEYLEIFNASDRLLSLADVVLSDGVDETILPGVTLGSGEYLLLTPTSAVANFEVTAKVGVSDWVSLSNSGERLSLMLDSHLIFMVDYTTEWHDTDELAEGGVSLEMKDLLNPCAGALNWGSSANVSGGTPGRANSNAERVPDHFGPNLLNVFTRSADSLLLVFDEPLMYGSEETASVTIEPSLLIEKIITDKMKRETLKIKMKDELVNNVVYNLKVRAITDCNGNFIRQNSQTFVLPDKADSLEVELSEVLFNPRNEGVDFVEIYNQSDQYFNLEGWQVARLTGDEWDTKIITTEPVILGPKAYLALTSDTMILKTQYPSGSDKQLLQVSSLPSFPNEEGTVVLINADKRIIDQFSYQEDFHLTLLKDVDGVSLERISFTYRTQDPGNWRSAASSVGFATPGYANSQSFEAESSNAVLQIDPKVFVPGSVNPTGGQSFTTINYQFDQGGKFANIMIYNQLGQPVAELAKGASLGTSGFVRWDGTSSTGSMVRMGYYIVVFEVYDGKGNQQVMRETVVVGR